MNVVPLTLREANDFVESYHRHSDRTSRDGGKFAISLLSGHVGGANELTEKVASVLGAQAVVPVVPVRDTVRTCFLAVRYRYLEDAQA